MSEAPEWIREGKKNGKSALFFKSLGYADSILLKAGYTESELKEAKDSIENSRLCKYGTSDSARREYVEECIRKGYTPYHTIKTGISIEYIIQSTYSVQDWISDGYSLSFLKKYGFPIKRFKEENVSAKELKDIEVRIDDLISAGYTLEDLISAGYSDEKLISKGYTKYQIDSVKVSRPIIVEETKHAQPNLYTPTMYLGLESRKSKWKITGACRERDGR